MWTTPSVSSIFARWLPSRTSSTMSGWSVRAAPTASTCPCEGPVRSIQTLVSGWRRNSGSRSSASAPLTSWSVSPTIAQTRRTPGTSGLARALRRETRLAGSQVPRVSDRARSRLFGRHRGSKPPAGAARRGGGFVRQHTRPAAQHERRRDGHGGHGGGHEEQPHHDPGGLARRPGLERVHDERVAERPVAELLRDELEVGLGRGVDLVAEPVDRRRPVGGQDRQADGHPDHPGDGDDRRGDAEQLPSGRLDRRRGARGDGEPEPETEDGEGEGDASRSRCPVVQTDIASSPPMARPSPTIVTSRSPVRRTRNPETRAPTAVAPASAPSASRCSSGPPYSTRSTKTAAPMIAVAKRVAGQERDE